MSKGRQMISTRFDDETIARLKELAEERKTSVAALIREAVMALLDEDEKMCIRDRLSSNSIFTPSFNLSGKVRPGTLFSGPRDAV